MNGEMRAAVVEKPGVLTIMDLPIPVPGPYEALCTLEYGATCTATDLHIIDGTIPFAIPCPAILGHESVGRVLEVGTKVRNFAQGDLVTRVGSVPCPITGSTPHGVDMHATASPGITGQWRGMALRIPPAVGSTR
jgi:D-arabinose 1-dehydrogenase-like Zn-dependent alcohol dehydrogenase